MRRYAALLLGGWLWAFTFGALDPPHWHGLVIHHAGKLYGFRFVMVKGKQEADGYDTLYLVHRPGPVAPDGSFALISFDPSLPFGLGKKTPVLPREEKPLFKITYGKYKNGVVGLLEIPRGIKIRIVFYRPWNMGEEIIYRKGAFRAGSNFRFTALDPWKVLSPTSAEVGPGKFRFYAGFEDFHRSPGWIEDRLQENLKKYRASAPRARGEWEGFVASISRNLLWMKLLQPEKGKVYIPAGRRWIFPGPDGKRDLWTLFEWDSFFNAAEASVFDCSLARREIEAVLETIYPWGNLPNWRSARNGCRDHSQPPVGSFLTLKVYLKCGDRALLQRAYPILKKWLFFWIRSGNGHKKRDGNGNGLLEWGSDTPLISPHQPPWELRVDGRQRAAWESGQDDLPNFDSVKFNEETHTMEMDTVDLSSLHALDLWAMGEIARILGKRRESAQFKKLYRKMAERINALLWDGDFYRDRFWGGKFSPHKAASNFYPLLAGVVPRERALRLLAHLRNPREFWGKYILPTISRDDPAFKDQQYWRGTIWPPTNYLVYHGLRRAGFDLEASALAISGARLFLRSWKTYGLCRENYNSITGEGGGQRYQSWGPLFALALLEDFIDITPWEGFRIGNLSASSPGQLLNIKIQGKGYNLKVSHRGLALYSGGKKILAFSGRGVLKDLEWDGQGLRAELRVYSEKLTLHFRGKKKTYPRGRFKLEISSPRRTP